jgi:hypothetical protein
MPRSLSGRTASVYCAVLSEAELLVLVKDALSHKDSLYTRVTNGTMLVVFVFRTQVELQKIFLEARVIQHHIQH